MSLTAILIYALFGIFFIGSLWKPILGIAGYLSVYILYNPEIWWGQSLASTLSRPSFLAIIFLAAGCILHAQKLNWKITRNEITLYVFGGLAWIVSLWGGVGLSENSLAYLEKLTKTFVFIFLFIRCVNSMQRYRFVVWIMILGGIFLAFQAHSITSSLTYQGRLEDLGGIDFREANQLAGFLSLSMILLGYQILQATWMKKLLFTLAITIILDTIVMTQSRAVFIGMLAAVPFVFWQMPRKHKKPTLIYLALGAVLLLALSDVKFLQRMDTIKDSAQLISMNTYSSDLTRIDIWKASWSMFLDHPLGIGVKNFEQLGPRYDPRNKGMDAHNTYVLCYSELGILGIVLFMIIIFRSFSILNRLHKSIAHNPQGSDIHIFAASLYSSLLVYTLGLMVTHSILYSEILWILLSLPIILERAANNAIEVQGNRL